LDFAYVEATRRRRCVGDNANPTFWSRVGFGALLTRLSSAPLVVAPLPMKGPEGRLPAVADQHRR